VRLAAIGSIIITTIAAAAAAVTITITVTVTAVAVVAAKRLPKALP
jgi:hypothetical protein